MFCGLPQHQALVRFGTTSVAVLEPLSEEDIAELSDPDKEQDDIQHIVDRAEAELAEMIAAGELAAQAAAEEAAAAEAQEAASAGDGAPEGEAGGDGEDGEVAPEEVPAGETAADVTPAANGDGALEPQPEGSEPDGELEVAEGEEAPAPEGQAS
jgi:N utilization substance protein A